MLDMFRKRGFSSVIYSALLGAVIVVFIIQFRPNSGNPLSGLSRKCVAKVRGTCIDEKDWRSQLYMLKGPYEHGPGINFNKMALDSLIERTLLEHEAARLGIRVNDDDVMQELIRWKAYIHVPAANRPQMGQLGVAPLGFRGMQFGTKEKPFDQNIFEQTIRRLSGQGVVEFTDNQQKELLAARMLQLVAQRVKIGDEEAWAQYKSEKSTTTLRYVRFQPAYFGERFVSLDPAEIEKWATANAKEVEEKEKSLPKDDPKLLVHPRHVLISSKKEDTADKKAIAKKKAEDIAERARKGEDFAALAKDNSEDPGSKDKGGEYDWTTGAEYVPEFKDAVRTIKLGETRVVETQFGLHVIQVMARLEGKAAIALPLYRTARGVELAKEASAKVEVALKAKLPVVVDDAVRAKIEELKKSGKNEVDAGKEAIDAVTKERTDKTIDEVLGAMAPKEVAKPESKKDEPKKDEPKKDEPKKAVEPKKDEPKKDEPKKADEPKKDEPKKDEPKKAVEPKKDEPKKDEPKKAVEPKKDEPKKDEKKDAKPVVKVDAPPAWKTDDRKPRVEELTAFGSDGPVLGFEDGKEILEAAPKLTKEAPLSTVLKSADSSLLVFLKDRHDATRDEFKKDRPKYVGMLLHKKREDAIVNFLTGLRDALGKDLTIDQVYSNDAKAPGAPPPSDPEGP